jgi:hypothetical protein
MSTWTGAISTDWNNVGNWAAGGVGTGIPSATVDAIFSGTPTNPCIMGANRVCRALSFIGYTSTLTAATFTLTANNNITFQADQSSRVIGTTGRLACNASGTITSNNGIWPLDFTINNNLVTMTLADDMRVTGSWLGSAGGGGTVTLAGAFTLFVGTNITAINGLASPITNVVMNGSGTYSGNSAYNLEINTTGNIIITGSVTFTRRFIITAVGSITMTAANVTIQGAANIDLGGRTIGNLTHSASGSGQIINYLTNLICNNFSVSAAGGNFLNGPGKVFVNGNYVLGANAISNLVVELIGTGTISTGTISLPCVVNCSAGTYTLGATLTINNTFTYTSGIVNTGISTVTLNNGISLSSAGINWYNITIPVIGIPFTITLNSLMTVTNNLTLASTLDMTFAGTAGWTCANLLRSAADRTITLQEGITYTTTNSVNMLGTNAQRIKMQSSSLTNRAIWTLNQGASQSVVYVNGTRIDSSLGQTIWSFGGTLNNTINWALGTKPPTVSVTFIG